MHETNYSAAAAPQSLLFYQPFLRAALHNLSLTVGVAHGYYIFAFQAMPMHITASLFIFLFFLISTLAHCLISKLSHSVELFILRLLFGNPDSKSPLTNKSFHF